MTCMIPKIIRINGIYDMIGLDSVNWSCTAGLPLCAQVIFAFCIFLKAAGLRSTEVQVVNWPFFACFLYLATQ